MTSKSDGRLRPWEKFVRAYMAGYLLGESSTQIAKRCETTVNALFVHANHLRRLGVRIPRLSDRFDAAHLNGVIRTATRKHTREKGLRSGKQTAQVLDGGLGQVAAGRRARVSPRGVSSGKRSAQEVA